MVEQSFGKGLSIPEIKYVAKGNPITYEELEHQINQMLWYVLDEMIRELTQWINLYVPKRTGQLRDTMTSELNTSEVVGGQLYLQLGTPLQYAAVVNEMLTQTVRHVGQWGKAYYYGESGWIKLMDPFAIGNFFNKYVEFADDRLTNITQRTLDEFFEGTGKLMRMVRGRMG